MNTRAKSQRRQTDGKFAPEGKPATSAATTTAERPNDESDEWLRKARNLTFESEARALADDPNCTTEALAVLSDYASFVPDGQIGELIASHHNTDDETLLRFAEGDISTAQCARDVWTAQCALTWNNRNTPPAALKAIIENDYWESKPVEGAFLHPNCPEELVKKYALESRESELRKYALQSERCPKEVRVEAAASDLNEACRAAAANDPIRWKDVFWARGPIGFDDTVKSADVNELLERQRAERLAAPPVSDWGRGSV